MAPRDAMLGKRIPRYRILEKLGGCGRDVVYEAESTCLDWFGALESLAESCLDSSAARHRD